MSDARTEASLSRLAALVPQLSVAYLRMRGQPPEALRPAGRGGARHVGVLVALLNDGPGSVSEIAGRLGMSLAHASLVIGELADAGLVIREPDPEDRRRVVVSLSEKAEPGVSELRRRSLQPLESFLRDLSPPDAEEFVGHLARLVVLMAEHPGSEGLPTPR